ncbi:L,D-transpeptidase [Aurantimonas sp. A2-1-M11]|uniref:L,D-transpeptidase n=1 Tax=Aurantimonas sp. A2-1-M11 TaxID=3113712 RepID=UPI002F91F106
MAIPISARRALVGLMAILACPAASQAQERYRTLPPVEIAPDLADRWLLQLAPAHGSRGAAAAGVVLGGRRAAMPAAPSGARLVVRPGYAQPAMRQRVGTPVPGVRAGYLPGGARTAVPVTGQQQAALAGRQLAAPNQIDPQFLPQTVPYRGKEAPGTIVVDARAKFLYHIGHDGTARRYGVGVGKPGFGWKGRHPVTRKAEWPSWTPPKEMIARERRKGRILPAHMKGGEANPLGARALYLGSTLYRIHGTNQPWTIGRAVSSGCIRMRNQDVMELYDRVKVGTKVVVI